MKKVDAQKASTFLLPIYIPVDQAPAPAETTADWAGKGGRLTSF